MLFCNVLAEGEGTLLANNRHYGRNSQPDRLATEHPKFEAGKIHTRLRRRLRTGMVEEKREKNVSLLIN